MDLGDCAGERVRVACVLYLFIFIFYFFKSALLITAMAQNKRQP